MVPTAALASPPDHAHRVPIREDLDGLKKTHQALGRKRAFDRWARADLVPTPVDAEERPIG